MSYKTKNILSVSPPSRASTGLARGALLTAMPWLAALFMAFLSAIVAAPAFGVLLGGLVFFYAPLLVLSRRSNVSIDKELNVSWTPACRPNHKLLKQSIVSAIGFTVTATIFLLTR